MPLDRVKGEHIEGLGEDYRIVPLAKWADTSLWDAACQNSTEAFARAGALVEVVFDDQHVLVQEYQTQDRLAFLFCRNVPVFNWRRGKKGMTELFHPVVMLLSPGLKAELVMSGRWQSKVLN